MCLTVDLTEHKWIAGKKMPSPKIAKADIPVVKILETRDNGETWLSPFSRYPYERNVIYYQTGKDKFEISRSHWERGSRKRRQLCRITEGLHSFQSAKDARTYSWLQASNRGKTRAQLHEGIIPKGAKYYVGKRGDLVSDQLQIFIK